MSWKRDQFKLSPKKPLKKGWDICPQLTTTTKPVAPRLVMLGAKLAQRCKMEKESLRLSWSWMLFPKGRYWRLVTPLSTNQIQYLLGAFPWKEWWKSLRVKISYGIWSRTQRCGKRCTSMRNRKIKSCKSRVSMLGLVLLIINLEERLIFKYLYLKSTRTTPKITAIRMGPWIDCNWTVSSRVPDHPLCHRDLHQEI